MTKSIASLKEVPNVDNIEMKELPTTIDETETSVKEIIDTISKETSTQITDDFETLPLRRASGPE